MKRYSKKREAIINILKASKSHPSAMEIFLKVKEIYPDISLGTVYRNLQELKEDGTINSLGKINDIERFDGTTMPHAHLICRKCGKVIDLDEISIDKDVVRKIEEFTGSSVLYSYVELNGICKECKENK